MAKIEYGLNKQKGRKPEQNQVDRSHKVINILDKKEKIFLTVVAAISVLNIILILSIKL